MFKQRSHLHIVLTVKCPNPTEELIMGVVSLVAHILSFFYLFVYLFIETGSHYIAAASLEHYVDQASLKVIETCLPLRVLGPKACSTIPSSMFLNPLRTTK